MILLLLLSAYGHMDMSRTTPTLEVSEDASQNSARAYFTLLERQGDQWYLKSIGLSRYPGHPAPNQRLIHFLELEGVACAAVGCTNIP